MTFSNDSQLDPGRVGGGGGRGVAVGGGIGGTLLLLVVGLFFGQDGIDALTGDGQDTGGAASGQEQFAHCETGADANRYSDCRMIATAQSLDRFWEAYLPQATGEREARRMSLHAQARRRAA